MPPKGSSKAKTAAGLAQVSQPDSSVSANCYLGSAGCSCITAHSGLQEPQAVPPFPIQEEGDRHKAACYFSIQGAFSPTICIDRFDS